MIMSATVAAVGNPDSAIAHAPTPIVTSSETIMHTEPIASVSNTPKILCGDQNHRVDVPAAAEESSSASSDCVKSSPPQGSDNVEASHSKTIFSSLFSRIGDVFRIQIGSQNDMGNAHSKEVVDAEVIGTVDPKNSQS